MELGFFMGLATPPIHFGRVILYVWSSIFFVSLFGPFTVFYATCTLGGTCVPYSSVSPNVMLLIQYTLYIIFSQDS